MVQAVALLGQNLGDLFSWDSQGLLWLGWGPVWLGSRQTQRLLVITPSSLDCIDDSVTRPDLHFRKSVRQRL